MFIESGALCVISTTSATTFFAAAPPNRRLTWMPSRATEPLGVVRTWAGNTFLPLWILFVVVTVPTFILWRRDRRHPRGHCQRCGYDLTGNVSGRCPECGEAT